MQTTSILNNLQMECPFPQAFEETRNENGVTGYRWKVGHTRADYDGYRWWNTIWPYNQTLCTPEIAQEIDTVYTQLLAPDAFCDLNALKHFCDTHQEATHHLVKHNFDFYYEGTLCYYWIRCITRNKDYNLYLHVFAKNTEKSEVDNRG